jgi:hypothetical protein
MLAKLDQTPIGIVVESVPARIKAEGRRAIADAPLRGGDLVRLRAPIKGLADLAEIKCPEPATGSPPRA